VLSLKLQNAGFEVLTAADGEEGFEVALRQVPDLVITDFQMPYMTGLELCKALAGEPATSRIPVIMLTARGYALEPEDLDPEVSGGNICDVLNKPFSPRAIVEQIHRILGTSDNSASQGDQIRSEVA
jgi:CheY-like chemotaxis protein